MMIMNRTGIMAILVSLLGTAVTMVSDETLAFIPAW
jgi:hypothetical protein